MIIPLEEKKLIEEGLIFQKTADWWIKETCDLLEKIDKLEKNTPGPTFSRRMEVYQKQLKNLILKCEFEMKQWKKYDKKKRKYLASKK